MKITKVALKYGEKIYSLPPPARHHNLMKEAKNYGWTREEVLAADQGFMYVNNETDPEIWCDRGLAFTIVAKNGQIVNILNSPPGILFSEHLW